jgi:hypothetical protein
MLRLLHKKEKEERRAEREERNAEREMKKAAQEHEVKVRELAVKEEEIKLALAHGGKVSGSSTVQKSHVKLPRFEEGQDVDIFL